MRLLVRWRRQGATGATWANDREIEVAHGRAGVCVCVCAGITGERAPRAQKGAQERHCGRLAAAQQASVCICVCVHW